MTSMGSVLRCHRFKHVGGVAVMIGVFVLLLAIGPGAAGRGSDGRTPQDGSRFCRKVVRSGEMWTRPHDTSRVGRFTIQTTLTCRKARRLVGRLIADGLAGMPRNRPRSEWNCRVTYDPVYRLREAKCKRYRGEHLSYVRFFPYYRFRVLISEVRILDCGAKGQNGSEADRPVTFEWDYGGPGDYNPDAETPTGAGGTPWVYDEPGKYTVTLTMRDNDGKAARATEQITVNDGPRVPCGSGGVGP